MLYYVYKVVQLVVKEAAFFEVECYAIFSKCGENFINIMMCSSVYFEEMISSMFTKQVYHLERFRINSSARSKVAGAFVNTNVMQRYTKLPSFDIWIFQYPFNASTVDNMRASLSKSMPSPIVEREYDSLRVIVFSFVVHA